MKNDSEETIIEKLEDARTMINGIFFLKTQKNITNVELHELFEEYDKLETLPFVAKIGLKETLRRSNLMLERLKKLMFTLGIPAEEMTDEALRGYCKIFDIENEMGISRPTTPYKHEVKDNSRPKDTSKKFKIH